MVGWGEETQSLESFLVLSGVDLGNNLFQLPLCLALGEVIHVVVLRGHSEIKIFSVPFNKYYILTTKSFFIQFLLIRLIYQIFLKCNFHSFCRHEDYFHCMYVCSPDYLKLGFRCTRRLKVRILWPILAW